MSLQALKLPRSDLSDRASTPNSHTRETKLFASTIERIIDEATGQSLGWVYEWNDGEQSEIWTSRKQRQNVIYVSCSITLGKE